MKKSIEDFLNDEVKKHAIHIITERALPSVIDGLKIGQRKIVYTAYKVAKQFMKTSSLAGYVSPIGGYDKGDASISPAIIKLVQNFAGTNNIPLLEGSGTFGSRFFPKGAAAPRYTKVKISNNFNKMFGDSDLLTYSIQDEEEYEPNYFLPIIPMILVNTKQGIASGWDCMFQSYKISDIVKNIQLVLDNKSQRIMKPYFDGYQGKIVKEIITHNWIMYGCIEKIYKGFQITEIPINISREKYIEVLNKLIDKNIISGFDDNCFDNKFLFDVKLNRLQNIEMEKLNISDWLKLFKLEKTLHERLNCITEDGKLILFKNPNEIIDYFVKFRLKMLTTRKESCILKAKEELSFLGHKLIFIQSVLDGGIDLNDIKSKNELENFMTECDIAARFIPQLIQIPIHKFNEEEIENIRNEIDKVTSIKHFYKSVSEINLFLEDLTNL